MEQIRISGKILGKLALSNFCPRCFWIMLHCRNKLPYQIFPGIFNNIDSYTKKITKEYFKSHLRLPSWFEAFNITGKPVKVPGHIRFNIVDEKTNIKLTGAPDEIFCDSDGEYFIVDYKTAKFTGTQDKLFPMYKIQLNAYAYIAENSEKVNFSPVRGLGLIFYEPLTEVSRTTVDFHIIERGFSMRFSGHFLPVELDLDEIPELLGEARKIYDMEEAPNCIEECKECKLLDQLLKVA